MKRIICLAFLSITASVVADEKRYDFRASAAYEQLSVADRQRLQQVRRDQFLLWGALDMYAAFGNAETIQQLLDGGALTDAKDMNGDTPLGWASWYTRPEAVLRKLCYGEFTSAKAESRWRTISWANRTSRLQPNLERGCEGKSILGPIAADRCRWVPISPAFCVVTRSYRELASGATGSYRNLEGPHGKGARAQKRPEEFNRGMH